MGTIYKWWTSIRVSISDLKWKNWMFVVYTVVKNYRESYLVKFQVQNLAKIRIQKRLFLTG